MHAPSDAHSGAATPAVLHTTKQSTLVIDPIEVPVGREQAAVPSGQDRAPVNFEGRGVVRLLTVGNIQSGVAMTWLDRERGTQTVVETTTPEWTARFAAGEHVLASAHFGGEAWQVVDSRPMASDAGPVMVSLAPGWARLVDVYGEDEPDTRLPVVTVHLNPLDRAPESAPVSISRKRQPDGRVELVTSAPDELGREISSWRIERSPNPVVLPQGALGSKLRVSANGYVTQDVELPSQPSVTMVRLVPSRALIVRVQGADAAALLEAQLVDGDVVHESTTHADVEPGVRRFDGVRSDLVRLEILVSARDGSPSRRLLREIAMEKRGETHVDIDLRGVLDHTVRATVEVELVTERAAGDLAPAKFGLLRFDGSRQSVDARVEPIWVPFQQFAARDGGGVFTAMLQDVSPGRYIAVLTPIGAARAVDVRADVVNRVSLEIAPVAKLTIWPVRANGERAGAAQQLGAVFWKPVCAPLDGAGDASGSLSRSTPTVTGADVKLGLARAAGFSNGAWEVNAPARTRIVVSCLGPSALGAKSFEITLEAGVQEAVLEFSNL